MPSPRKDENKDEFISRCMSDEESQRTFPDEEQRAAFCYSQWENKDKKNGNQNMKSLHRIQKAIYNQPWLVLPSVHESLRTQLENVLSGKTQLPNDMPMDDEDMEDEDVLTPTEPKPSLAVVSIDGIIGKHLGMLETMCGGVDVDMISDALDELETDPNITDILLYFNTPGGTVVGVPELGEKIAALAKKKRCIAYADVLCASAGYWLASQCDALYCAPSAEVGSIGVYSLFLDESRALDNAGIKVNAISAGKYKLTGAPFKPMTEEEKDMLQKDVDKIYSMFKSAVTAKRDVEDEDMQGQVFDGEEAVKKGLADGTVNSLNDMVSFLTTKPI